MQIFKGEDTIKTEANVPVQIIATMDVGKQATGSVREVHLNPQDRLLMAAKTLGLCWLGALFAVLIPIAHFVLVPAGLIAGVVMARRAYGFSQQLNGGSVSCPKCFTAIEVSKKPFTWPKHENCSHCGIDILLKKTEAIV